MTRLKNGVLIIGVLTGVLAVLLFGAWMYLRKPPAVAKLHELSQTVDNQRVELIQAHMALKDAETKAGENKSDPAVAAALADMMKKLEAMQASINSLENQNSTTTNDPLPPPVVANPLPPPDTQPVDAPPSPLPEPSNTQEAKDQSQKTRDAADQAAMQALAAGICIMQPEVCPFAAVLGQILGAFGSSQERDEFVKTITKIAQGDPLSPQDIKTLTNGLGKNFDKLAPGAIDFYQHVAKATGTGGIQSVINQEIDKQIAQHPELSAFIDPIKTAIQQHPINVTQIVKAVQDKLPGSQFPSLQAKQDVIKAAAGLGVSKDLLDALEAIPSP